MQLTQKNLQSLDQKCDKSQIQTSIYPKQASSQALSSKTISSLCQNLNPEAKCQIRDIYSKLDNGRMKPQEAKNLMEQQLGIKVTLDLERSLNKVDPKFKDIWNNIEKSKQINILPTEKPTAINPHRNILHIKGYTDNLPRYQSKRLNVQSNNEQKNKKKEELLSLCQSVCSGKEITKGFITKLKENNLELSELTHELKELQASSQVPFSQLSSKLFRAIDNQDQRANYDKPLVHANPKIINEYYSTRSQLQKNQNKKPQTSEIIKDSQHKIESAYQTFHQPSNINPVFSDSQFAILSVKKKMDVSSTKAMQNNGNIISWKNKKQPDQQKKDIKENSIQSRVKSNYQMSPDKWKSKFTLDHNEAIQIAPQSTRGKNLKDFQGSGDIISWNQKKIN